MYTYDYEEFSNEPRHIHGYSFLIIILCIYKTTEWQSTDTTADVSFYFACRDLELR